MPLAQGLVWTLVVSGWRHWNSTTKFGGQTVGAKIRRWWWGVNNWKLPQDGSAKSERLSRNVEDYVTTQLSTGGLGDD